MESSSRKNKTNFWQNKWLVKLLVRRKKVSQIPKTRYVAP